MTYRDIVSKLPKKGHILVTGSPLGAFKDVAEKLRAATKGYLIEDGICDGFVLAEVLRTIATMHSDQWPVIVASAALGAWAVRLAKNHGWTIVMVEDAPSTEKLHKYFADSYTAISGCNIEPNSASQTLLAAWEVMKESIPDGKKFLVDGDGAGATTKSDSNKVVNTGFLSSYVIRREEKEE